MVEAHKMLQMGTGKHVHNSLLPFIFIFPLFLFSIFNNVHGHCSLEEEKKRI